MRWGVITGTVLLFCLCVLPVRAQEAPKAGTTFRDCTDCPQMIVIGPGSFMMGDAGHTRESPVHQVNIKYSFAIGQYTVTFDEWDACVTDGGCAGYRPYDSGWGRGRRPVINVSWSDADNYARWLTRKTGKPYRLVTEAEWEYAARAGTTTAFWWGNDMGRGNANCDGCGSQWDNKQTAPVGSFKPNAFGVYDTMGNLTQWVADPWHSTYAGAPTDGSVWEPGDPQRRVMRNGSWFNSALRNRTAFRNGDSPVIRNAKIGFRIARTM